MTIEGRLIMLKKELDSFRLRGILSEISGGYKYFLATPMSEWRVKELCRRCQGRLERIGRRNVIFID